MSSAPIRSSNPVSALLGVVANTAKRARQRLVYQGIRSRVNAASGINVSEIKTYTRPDELAALYQLVPHIPPGTHAVEIGSHLGASSCYIAAALLARPGATLVCVDTWNNETMPEGSRDTMAEFQTNTRNLSHIIRTVRKPSETLTGEDFPSPLGFVFIDGDHSYKLCRNDFEKVESWVVPGGIVAFHDAIGDGFPGVGRVVGEAWSGGRWTVRGLCRTLCWIERRKEEAK
jgi:predicted O-methyltransferase YrrM